MSEEAGRAAVAARVPRGTLLLLDRYVALLRDAAARQNLVAVSTLPDLWHRHILDSLQLAELADVRGRWIDVGSGAGLPGIVAAIATGSPTWLIEPRRLRAAFLETIVADLGLGDRVTVHAVRCEAVPATGAPAAIVSARAVAALPALLAMAAHLAGPETQWLLPKGRSADAEVAEACRTWQGRFRLVPSLTDASAMIVEARAVRRKGQG